MIRAFDADVVVVPEAFRDVDGSAVLDPLGDDGYQITSTLFRRIEAHDGFTDLRPAGEWELSVCSRLPVVAVRHIPLVRVLRDHAERRAAIACTVDVGGAEVDVVGVHVSSKLWFGGPAVHLRGLRPMLPPPDRPAVVAGDCNLWGPGVLALLRGWRRAVVGRTYPANRPHSQIDHILVNDRVEVLDGRVLHDVGSDHRPVVARLRVR